MWYTYVFRNALIGMADRAGNIYRDLQDSRAVGIMEGGRDVMPDEGKRIAYAGVATQYFAAVTAVNDEQEDRSFLEWARPTVEADGPKAQPYLADLTTRVVAKPLELKKDQPITHRYVLYNGPVKVRLLGTLDGADRVDAELVTRYEDKLFLSTLADYPSPNVFGTFASTIGWSRLLIFCTNVMHRLLDLLHGIVPNYGLCIMLLTLMVRGAMFPLSRKQAISSARMQEKMAELAPEVKKLEEKHKSDPMALQQAKNELYLRRGVNPLAMMGSCWMIFLQMPIFLGLYYALQESIHFRLARYLWIENLAAPDMLLGWGEKIPWISRPEDQGGFLYLGPFLNILPLVAVVLMIVQQKMLMPPPQDEQQAMQQSMTKYMMIIFGLMFYKVAAGLCIYFIISSLWGLTERKLLPKKQLAPAGAEALVKRDAPGGKNRPRGGPAPRENGDGVVQRLKEMWAEVLKQAKKK